jgi:choline dehydrogenase-like flavoprotein
LLLDARTIPRDSTLETDICIVGAGAAGITLARELADRPFRVALLESGGFEAEPDTQALYRGRVHGRPYFKLHEARSRQFGGSTNCWHGMCRPLEPIDFEARDWVPRSGWPFGSEELRPYYERAQAVCRLEAFDYGAGRWESPERMPLAFASDAIESRVFQVAAHRFGAIYRAVLTRAANLHTYLFANVVEFEANEPVSRVARVRVACLDGNRFSLRARHFVLATGGIENARLLLVSNRRRGVALGNAHGLVGRYFMEHPHVLSGAFLPSNSELSLGFYRARPAGSIVVSGLLIPSPAVQRRERMLGFGAFLAPTLELPPFEVSLARMIAEMDGHPEAPAQQAVLFMNEAEQAPNRESRVRLTQERDALGVPVVQLEWRLSSIDKRSLRRGHEILARELGRAGLGRLQILLDEDDHRWPREMEGGRHHMGTTRMHADPKQGVVDPDARVHGIENLYVAGSSVFPTSGASNPTLTLVALALRLADRLAERMR